MAQAAVVVLPTCRAVSARMDAPRGARKNVSCHRSRCHSQNFAHPEDRIDAISNFTSVCSLSTSNNACAIRALSSGSWSNF